MHRLLFLVCASLFGLASSAEVFCEDLLNANFTNINAYVISAVCYPAASTIAVKGGQSVCTSSAYTEVDICRVTVNIITSEASETYAEIWLPNQYYDSTDWNGRMYTASTGGLSGCVMYSDLRYATSMGFAAVANNAGHNGTVGDGSAFLNNNEIVLDFSHRACADGQAPSYSYYVGCSTGRRQGMKSALMYPEDFDGIIAGSAASDFNHEADWTSRFILLTGTDSSDPKFLTVAEWAPVHQAVLAQCDEPLDGVADGFLEDSTIRQLNATVLLCQDGSSTDCLTPTQITTVNNVSSQLYDQNGLLLYPRLSPGSELLSAEFGPLSGSVQGTADQWFRFAVWNNSDWSSFSLSQTDYTQADEEDELHGYISTYSGDLSGMRDAGAKMITYHGSDDPLIASEQSQRYYLHVAATMGLSNDELLSLL